MDVFPDVTLTRQSGLTSVNPHPHADEPVAQRVLGFGSGRQRLLRTPKHEEESVALSVDLDAMVRTEHLTEQTAVLREDHGVPLTEFPLQPRRPLDVGEKERECA